MLDSQAYALDGIGDEISNGVFNSEGGEEGRVRGLRSGGLEGSGEKCVGGVTSTSGHKEADERGSGRGEAVGE